MLGKVANTFISIASILVSVVALIEVAPIIKNAYNDSTLKTKVDEGLEDLRVKSQSFKHVHDSHRKTTYAHIDENRGSSSSNDENRGSSSSPNFVFMTKEEHEKWHRDHLINPIMNI